MTRAGLLFRHASPADTRMLRFRLAYPRRTPAADRALLARHFDQLTPDEQGQAVRAAEAFARFVDRTATPLRCVPHAVTWLRAGGWRDDWTTRTEPLRSPGACCWNAGSTLYPFMPPCAEPAVIVAARGAQYCERHAQAVGLRVRGRGRVGVA